MIPQPPNSHCIANQSVMPLGQPPFRWAVFATTDLPDDVIAFYTRALGRAADEAGHKWGEPRDNPLHSVTVHPAERVDALPPMDRGRVPPGTRTLILLLQRSAAPAPRQPYQDNVLPLTLSTAALLEATRAGRLTWAASDKGPVRVLKAGGRVPAGLHAGRDIWVTVSRTGREYLLALTAELQPYGEPLRQKDGWFRRCELGELWEAARRSSRPASPAS